MAEWRIDPINTAHVRIPLQQPMPNSGKRIRQVEPLQSAEKGTIQLNLGMSGHHDPQEVERAIEEINQQLKIFDRILNYRFDQDTNELIVKVVDAESGEVIRQIPPDQVLRAAKLMKELKGLLIDEWA